MSEFDEVGRTVENFASEDATIVIGTVLDPDMQDEVRVTVVATGLNRAPARASGFDGQGAGRGKPQVQLISNNQRGVRDGTTGMLIDDESDAVAAYSPGHSIAASLRGNSAQTGGRATPARADATEAPKVADFGNDNYLDIPAFLRRQAD